MGRKGLAPPFAGGQAGCTIGHAGDSCATKTVKGKMDDSFQESEPGGTTRQVCVGKRIFPRAGTVSRGDVCRSRRLTRSTLQSP
ncbi:MAG: hypothetical protein KatS3mg082_1533 [Nitrospiraceae bacterium]|jgi:hypothetical protein|nr:MAG: hypothetical protein KatS3mg082_1533 [Nitrospiraceae bacterium]